MSQGLVKLPDFPILEAEGKRFSELNFHGIVAAGAYLTLIAGRIPYLFRIIGVRMTFDIEHNNLVEYRWFISGNESAPTTVFPADTNIFGLLNPQTGFIGKGFILPIDCDVKVLESNRYVKMAVFNNTAYQVNVQGSCRILEM